LTEKRKTINGEDILTSMRALGFDNYEGVLKVYLAKFREVSAVTLSERLNQSWVVADAVAGADAAGSVEAKRRG
jgi:hypothetical protein